MLPILFVITISYLIGSIPTAYLFGRMLKGIDIRKHGSGNVGATNAFRILGKGPGITVLALDIIKGIIPVVVLGPLALRWGAQVSPELLAVLIGIACICGHNWTIFLRFKGGKGIATTLGVLIGLTMIVQGLGLVLGCAMATWFVVFGLGRIISLGSIIAALALPLYMLLFGQSPLMLVTSVLLCVFVLIRHKSNIQRLVRGTEPRLQFRKK